MDDISLIIMFGLLMALVGVIMCIVRANQVSRCSQIVSGLVVGHELQTSTETERDDNGIERIREKSMYHTVYSYKISDREYEMVSKIGSSTKTPKNGTTVTVFYNPSNEQDFYVKEESLGNNLGLVFVAIGAIIIVVALFILQY